MRKIIAVLVCAIIVAGCQSRARNPEIVGHVSRNNVAAVLAYLEDGGDPNLKNRDGDPLLYIASGAQGGVAVAKVLIEAGADVNAVSLEGRPILHNAASWCAIDMVVLLLKSDVDLDATNKNDETALDVVCKSPQDRRDAVLNLLLSARS